MAAGVKAGDLLAGKYLIDKVLGAGGMGVVVAAHHVHLDEKVAIKFLLPEAVGNPEAMARFSREARAAAKIKSEHVARVIDVGTLETGAPYIVMEYLEGGDLANWIQRQGALSIEDAVEFVLQACEALADAHGLGIIHRDLKPANLFWVRGSDGMISIKVLDFGISKITGLSSSGPDIQMTRTTAVMGSPYYMSPEQMQSSRNVDARADIWAVGIVLYELLAGRPPFRGDTLPEVCMSVSTKPPPPLRSVRPDTPAKLEAVILKCLEKDRNNRYAHVAELAVALAEFGPRRSRTSVDRIGRIIQNAGLSTSAVNLPISSDPQPEGPAGGTLASDPQLERPPPGGTLASWGHTQRGSKGRRGLVFALGGAGLVILLVTTMLLMRGRPADQASEVPRAALVTPAAAPPPVAAPTAVPAPAVTGAAPVATGAVPAATAAATAPLAEEKPAPRAVPSPAASSGPASAIAKKPAQAKAAPPPPAIPSRPPKSESKAAAPAANPDELGGRL
jgi:serine/threonine-protein kinase